MTKTEYYNLAKKIVEEDIEMETQGVPKRILKYLNKIDMITDKMKDLKESGMY